MRYLRTDHDRLQRFEDLVDKAGFVFRKAENEEFRDDTWQQYSYASPDGVVYKVKMHEKGWHLSFHLPSASETGDLLVELQEHLVRKGLKHLECIETPYGSEQVLFRRTETGDPEVKVTISKRGTVFIWGRP